MAATFTAADIYTSGGKYPDRPKRYPPTKTDAVNATLLASRVTRLCAEYERATGLQAPAPQDISSGYRPAAINAATPGAAKKSKHMICAAVDLGAAGGHAFALWCLQNESALAMCDLYLEHPDDTPTWCHLQCIPPGSGKRVFRAK